MKNYYDLFVNLSLQQCTESDYADRQKVKKHKAACKKLAKLQDEMKRNADEYTLHRLLNHEDDRVKINAASFCLLSRILVDQVVLALKETVAASGDSTMRLAAEMLLKQSTY